MRDHGGIISITTVGFGSNVSRFVDLRRIYDCSVI